MASKFDILIKTSRDKTLGPRVRMYDDDQDEYTPWVRLPVAFRGQPEAVIFAKAVLDNAALQEMVVVAQQVAYAVYLDKAHFDIHAVTPERCLALVAGAQLEQTTEPAGTRPATRSRRL